MNMLYSLDYPQRHCSQALLSNSQPSDIYEIYIRVTINETELDSTELNDWENL